MKLFQNSLRALIVAGSIGGFLTGWTFVAHAGKPAPADDTQSVITAPAPLPTLPPLDFSSNPSAAGLQPLQPLTQLPQTSQMPRVRLRTRGS